MTVPEADRGLVWRNRRLLAERLGWPAGALRVCEVLQRRYPGWHTTWLPASTAPGFEFPAGFYATDERGCGRRHLWAYGATPAALAADIALRQAAAEAKAAEEARWRGTLFGTAVS